MEIIYIRKGDYLFPNFALDPTEQVNVGKYGRLRWRYLQKHRRPLYWRMLIEGSLTQHLLEINESAQSQVDLTVKQLLKQYPAPDRDEDFLAYVGHMNSLTAMAEETVLRDMIYS